MKKCDLKGHLLLNKIRATKNRILVLELIQKYHKPISVFNLHQKIMGSRKIDLVTVYRILDLFKEKQIVREIFDQNGTQYFELACDHNPIHAHTICNRCKKMECLDNINLDMFSQMDIKRFHIQDLTVSIRGLCQECSN